MFLFLALQKGFTENSTPLLCELFIEEFERESKDSGDCLHG
jgi:hypothetical protein